MLKHPLTTSRLVPDPHLAAMAIEHGLTLYSTDGDFREVLRVEVDESVNRDALKGVPYLRSG